MKINRHNYEEYLIDFLDGNLSSSEVEAVKSFLEGNPDIKAEFEELNNDQLLAETLTFDKKNLLKKDPAVDIEGISKFEQLSIAKLENEITIEEEKVLAEFLKNSSKKRHEHQLIQKSRLEPDENITFKGKKALKHYQVAGNRKVVYWLSSIAASVALLISFFLVNDNDIVNKGLAIQYRNFNQPALRLPSKAKESMEIEKERVFKDTYAKVVNNEAVDSVLAIRENELVAEINPRKTEAIIISSGNTMLTSSDLSSLTINTFDKKLQEAKVEDYVNATLQKLGIEPIDEEKSLATKAGESVWQSVNKFIKKRFQVKKVEIEDGRKLYAVRAGSLEFYTNTKSRKNKNKKQK